jgi:hypothetical protein
VAPAPGERRQRTRRWPDREGRREQADGNDQPGHDQDDADGGRQRGTQALAKPGLVRLPGYGPGYFPVCDALR